MSENQCTQGTQGIPSYIDRNAVLSLLLDLEFHATRNAAPEEYAIKETIISLRGGIENLPAVKPQPMVESRGVVISSNERNLHSSIELLHIANVTLGQRYEDGEDPLTPCFSALDRAIEIVRADSSRTIQKMLELLFANQHFKREVEKLRAEISRSNRENAKVVDELLKKEAKRAASEDVEALKKTTQRLQRELDESEKRNVALRAEINDKSGECLGLNGKLKAAQHEIEKLKKGIENLPGYNSAEIDRLRAEVDSLRKEVDRRGDALARANQRFNEARWEKEKLKMQLEDRGQASAEKSCPECAKLRAANEKVAAQFYEEKRGFLQKIDKLEAERDQRNRFQAAMVGEWRKAFEKIWPGDESGLLPEQSAPYMADEILKLRAERDKIQAAYHRAEKEFAALEASKKEADSELRRMGREAGELRGERSKLFWEKEELRKFTEKVRCMKVAYLSDATFRENVGTALAELDAGTEPITVAEPAPCPECERLQLAMNDSDERITNLVQFVEKVRPLVNVPRRPLYPSDIDFVRAALAQLDAEPTPVAEPLDAEGGA